MLISKNNTNVQYDKKLKNSDNIDNMTVILEDYY